MSEKIILKPLKIHRISLMEGEYENVEYAGTKEDFLHNISNESFVNVYQDKESIWLNTDYIMSLKF